MIYKTGDEVMGVLEDNMFGFRGILIEIPEWGELVDDEKYDRLDDEMKKDVDKFKKFTYDKYKHAYEVLYKRLDNYMTVIEILRGGYDSKTIELLTELDSHVNWEEELQDDFFISRLIKSCIGCYTKSSIIKTRFFEKYNKFKSGLNVLRKKSIYESLGMDWGESFGSDCEIVGVCVCNSSDNPIPFGRCISDDSVMLKSHKSIKRRDKEMAAEFGKMIDDMYLDGLV